MLIGVIANDFTGAATSRIRLPMALNPKADCAPPVTPGIPDGPADPNIEAGAISLKSRSATVEQAVNEFLAALNWLRDQSCSQFVFKYCSTFDSTPDGNIGPVADAPADLMFPD